MSDASRSARGAQTREAITTAARALFLERGYDATTMRAVAQRAGVSLGNAYYYFASKDHLVQEFYGELQLDHAAAAEAALDGVRGLGERLALAWEAWVDVAEPLRPFAGSFFRVAAEPTGPLSPFSAESSPAREAGIELHRAVLDGADLALPSQLRAELPELLWLAHMGVVLFWVYDASPDAGRTRVLVRRAAGLIDRLLRLTRLPGARGLALDVVRLVTDLRTRPA
ncbi:MAG: TetR family transcriptional regulator [Micrococcales bacterium 73-15]|uniref:TetR/AcrR family transcriptional regulator n=1 Tax=Salana multivorans TaxID=120377 RepID=UPI000967242B|nr:TetR family transcriptional regulator [Salana multivorans]OJX94294.1 MAG: TetR family transcriptional regulator [Micrococcales bacterium 73-15]